MTETNKLLENFNTIDFMKSEELEKLDFYELSLYYEFLNNLEKEYDDLIQEEKEEA